MKDLNEVMTEKMTEIVQFYADIVMRGDTQYAKYTETYLYQCEHKELKCGCVVLVVENDHEEGLIDCWFDLEEDGEYRDSNNEHGGWFCEDRREIISHWHFD